MRVGILARKSTDKQATSLDRQIADATRFIEQQGWTLVPGCTFAVPEGVSGAITARPELRELVSAGQRRLIDAVVLQTNDRLTRRMVETVTLVVELRDVGIRAFSYSTGEEYKADSPTDRFLLAVKGFVAESERDSIVLRTTEAAFYRARLGFVAGNRLYGYDNTPFEMGGKTFKVRIPNEEEVKWVVWIHEKYDKGWGHRKIADELNRLGVASPRAGGKGPQVWRHTAVREVLRNESYVGVLVFGKTRRAIRGGVKKLIRTPERVERIVVPRLSILDEALWARNAARFAAHKMGTRKVGNTPTALLVGNLRCACGSRMGITGSNRVYTCLLRHQSGKKACQNLTSRPSDKLDELFVAELLRVIDQPKLVDEVVALHITRNADAPSEADERAELVKHVAELSGAIKNLETAIGKASNEAVITRLIGLIEEKQTALTAAEVKLAALKPRVVRTLDPEALRARAADKVVHLADVLRGDIPAGRDALRAVLAKPAEAVPILVNGQKRFLVRGQLSAEAVFGEAGFATHATPSAGFRTSYEGSSPIFGNLNSGGEPNGKISELVQGPCGGAGGDGSGASRHVSRLTPGRRYLVPSTITPPFHAPLADAAVIRSRNTDENATVQNGVRKPSPSVVSNRTSARAFPAVPRRTTPTMRLMGATCSARAILAPASAVGRGPRMSGSSRPMYSVR